MLARLFGSKLRAGLLTRLFSQSGERFFVRQLTALLGEDPANVSRELARLEQMGLLTSRVEGRQKYYQANPRYPAFEELRGLVKKTAGFSDILREALAPFAGRIAAAFIYGSFAAGTEGAESDVDLFMVGDIGLREIAPALRRAGRTLMREVNAVVLAKSEFARKMREREHFVTAVLESPKVFLIGGESDLKGIADERLSRKAQVVAKRDR
jgi:uncharacterized protein